MMSILIGFLIILFMLWFHKNEMRVEWAVVAKFLAFMSLVVCIRICLMSFISSVYSQSLHDPIADKISNWTLGLVFWEDAYFAIPIFLYKKYFNNRVGWVLFIIGISALFGSGHLYQGLLAVGITAIYPYVISYRYGVRYGFGTVMICHILYDHITVYLQKLLPYLLY